MVDVILLAAQVGVGEAGVAIAAIAFAGAVVTASFAFALKALDKLDKFGELVNRLITVEETRMRDRER